MECVDIICADIGITVWSNELPDDDDCLMNDGPLPFLDLVYPGLIPSVNDAIHFAKNQLGDFVVKSAG
jgi:hypothetical protein